MAAMRECMGLLPVLVPPRLRTARDPRGERAKETVNARDAGRLLGDADARAAHFLRQILHFGSPSFMGSLDSV